MPRPTPLPELLERHWQRWRRLWQWALLTPVIYLTIATFAERRGWFPPATPLAEPPETLAGPDWALAAIAGVLVISLVVIRLGLRFWIWNAGPSLTERLRRYGRLLYTMGMHADGLALLGLVAQWMLGWKGALLIGCSLAYLGYACCLPSRQLYAQLWDSRRPGDEIPSED